MNRRTFLKAAGVTAMLTALPFKAKASNASTRSSLMVIAHLDDGVIFLPPWLHKVDKVIVTALPLTAGHLNILSRLSPHYAARWRAGRGITSVQDFKERWLNVECRQKFITEESLDLMLRDLISDPLTTDVYTHTPWGEYGHAHHRMVSQVVRDLAVEYGKRVWSPTLVIRFPWYSPRTLEFANMGGFTQKRGYCSEMEYLRAKQIFLDEPINQTFSVDYWTWAFGNGQEYLAGEQRYFLAASDGVDWTIDDPEVQWLCEDLPIYGVAK